MPMEFARFLVVGGANTLVSYLFYLAVLWLGDSPLLAYNFSYALGIVVSYFLSLKVAFRRKHTTKKMLLFPLAYAVQYAVGFGGLKIFLSFGMPAELAGLLIIPLTVPVTFLCAKFFLK